VGGVARRHRPVSPFTTSAKDATDTTTDAWSSTAAKLGFLHNPDRLVIGMNRRSIRQWLRARLTGREAEDTPIEPIERVTSGRRDMALAGAVALLGPGLKATPAEAANTAPAQSGTATRNPHDGSEVRVVDAVATGGSPAIDDWFKSYFAVTWSTNQATLSIQSNIGPNGTAAVTVSNTGPNGVALVTIASSPGYTTGYGVLPEWSGKPIAIAGAGASGGTLIARVVSVYFNPSNSNIATAQLDRACGMPLAGASAAVACPCFVNGSDVTMPFTSCVRQSIFLSAASNGEGVSPGGTNPGQQQYPLSTTITGYTSPFSVRLAAPIGAPSVSAEWNGCLVAWGTNNTAAIIAASQYGVANNAGTLWFPGFTYPQSTGLFGALNWYPSNAGIAPSAATLQAATALATMLWVGRNAETFVVTAPDNNGWQMDVPGIRQAIPERAGAIPLPPRLVIGQAHLAPLAGLTTIFVCVVGDSWAATNSTGEQNNAIEQPILQELRRQNPGVTFIVANRGRGGSTWRMLTDPVAMGSGTGFSWVTNPAKPWSYFMQNATFAVGGSTVTAVPHLIVCASTGLNDSYGQLYSEPEAFIAWTTKLTSPSGAPPVVLLVSAGVRALEGFGGGNLESSLLNSQYGTRQVKAIALAKGLGLLDYGDRSDMVQLGWGENHLALKLVPPPPAGWATSTSAYAAVPYLCRDFFAAIRVAGTFGPLGTRLRVRLGPKPDNEVVLGFDAGGHAVCEVHAWGGVIATPVTCATNSSTLTTSGQSPISLAGATVTPSPPGWMVFSSTAPFSAAEIGTCFLATGCGQSYGGSALDYRTMIRGVNGSRFAFVADPNTWPSHRQPAGTSGYVGGWMFTPYDALAGADLVVPGAGSTTDPIYGANCLVTKVVTWNSRTSIAMAAEPTANLSASTQNVFLGRRIAYGSERLVAENGSKGVWTIRKTGTRVRIGYIPGNLDTGAVHSLLQAGDNDAEVFSSETGSPGGPFVPVVYADGATVTLQTLMCAVGERVYYQPTLTSRQMNGTADAALTGAYSGDTAHLSLLFGEHVAFPMLQAQDLVVPRETVAVTNGSAAPASGQTVAIRNNQAFTAINPVGTLDALTIDLPASFPQGGTVRVIVTQAITSLTISAAGGKTITGAAVSAASSAANSIYSYVLQGTVWYRVQ
jgi:hypothetical protein